MLAPILKQREQAVKYRTGEAGAGLVRNFATLARQGQRFGLAAFDEGDLGTMGKDNGLVTPRLQRTGLLQRLGLDVRCFGIAARGRQAETHRLGGEHFGMAVADPDGCFESLAHVAQPEVEIAGVDPAMPHHDPIWYGDPRQAMRVAEIDAAVEMPQRRRHAAIHILRVRQTAQRARLPFRRIGAA